MPKAHETPHIPAFPLNARLPHSTSCLTTSPPQRRRLSPRTPSPSIIKTARPGSGVTEK
jgi:hypothetical protein